MPKPRRGALPLPLTPPPHDTVPEMVSHELAVIRDVLNVSKFKHESNLVASRFTLMLQEYVESENIVRVRDLCRFLFQFRILCEMNYVHPSDFEAIVPFSREAISRVMDCDAEMPFERRLEFMKEMTLLLEDDLREVPGVKID